MAIQTAPYPVVLRSFASVSSSALVARRPLREFRAALTLSLLAAILFLARLPCGLLEPEEARYAEIPREMLLTGRWLTPVWQGENYLHKPPLLYWLIMLSYTLFGVHDWAARLVPALAGVATVLVTYSWARPVLGRRRAWAGALVLLLTARFVYLQGMIVFDGLLCLWATLSLALGHIALRGRFTWRSWLGSAAACALGIMTKGPVALALVAPPLLCLYFVSAARRKLRPPDTTPRFRSLAASYAAALLLLAGPWFVYLAFEHPDAAADFFWLHHVRRFVDPIDHAEPWWFFLPSLAVGTLPWGLFTLRRPARRSGAFWLAASWGLLFFSLSGCKRAVYVLPVLPPLAIALGAQACRTRWLFSAGYWTRRGWTLGAGTFLCLLAGTLFWLPAYHARYGLREELAAALRDGPAIPLYAYPRSWDSISFYVGQAREYGADQARRLRADLQRETDAWLVLRRRDAETVLRDWPDSLAITFQGDDRANVLLARVRARP